MLEGSESMASLLCLQVEMLDKIVCNSYTLRCFIFVVVSLWSLRKYSILVSVHTL